MRIPLLPIERIRSATALIAATAGVLICIHQKHFIPTPNLRLDWHLVEIHRCAQVLALSVFWVMAEFTSILLPDQRAWARRARR